MRRTKIVATLGPASSAPEMIKELIQSGVDIFRLNFSHGAHKDHQAVIETIRTQAKSFDRTVSILQDLQGPKIRVGEMENGSVLLHEGDTFRLTTEKMEKGTAERAYISYPTLLDDVQVGGHILLDDGHLELKVVGIEETSVVTEVVVGGPLRSRKGVNLPHIRATMPSLTEKDLEDLQFGLSMDVDIIALSFVRTEVDVKELMGRIRASGKRVAVIAKIEKPEAVDVIDQILVEADGIMVARGDLGIEMAMERLPGVQKMLIQKAREHGKPVITATQMLESMIENPRPTRAEASDVYNAVVDGTDAVMLSGETAVGKYPSRTVKTMARIICEAEAYRANARRPQSGSDLRTDGSITESISLNAFDIAEEIGAKAIACLTATGTTARAIARHRPSMPVYAFTDDERMVQQIGLIWGAKGFAIPFQRNTDEGIATVMSELIARELVARGDRIVIIAGMPLPAKGSTNMVLVKEVV